MYQDEYLLYARRSSADVDNQQNTIEYQVQRGLEYMRANGLKLADYTEKGFCERGIIIELHTAYKTKLPRILADGTVKRKIDRPKFKRLAVVLAQARFKGSVSLCLDRLSRNKQDEVVIDTLTEGGRDIRYVQANYEKSSAGHLHKSIDGVFAEHYSKKISESIRAANSKLRGEGKCTTRAPMGYLDFGPDNKPVDRRQADIIRGVFERYATGQWSFAEIAKWALHQGLTSKPRRRNRTRDEILAGIEIGAVGVPVARPVTEKTIEAVLHNPFYAGLLRHEDELHPGIHEPIITRDVFYCVQEKLRQRTQSLYYLDKDFYAYRGFLRCVCGRAYSPYTQKGHAYYTVPCLGGCTNRSRTLAGFRIDAMVEDLLGRARLTDEEEKFLNERAPGFFAQQNTKRADASKALDNRLRVLNRDLVYLGENKLTLIREGVYTGADVMAEIHRLEGESSDVRGKLSGLKEVTNEEKLAAVLTFSELVGLASSCYKYASEQQKHHLLTMALSELVIEGGNVAEIRAMEGFEALLKKGGSQCGG
ncbi:MAG: recombinase family protein [Patescibacteria group bacterium]